MNMIESCVSPLCTDRQIPEGTKIRWYCHSCFTPDMVVDYILEILTQTKIRESYQASRYRHYAAILDQTAIYFKICLPKSSILSCGSAFAIATAPSDRTLILPWVQLMVYWCLSWSAQSEYRSSLHKAPLRWCLRSSLCQLTYTNFQFGQTLQACAYRSKPSISQPTTTCIEPFQVFEMLRYQCDFIVTNALVVL